MAKPTYRFDRDILRDERAYWGTQTLEEVVPRVEIAKSGYEIYMLMSYNKGLTPKAIYEHFGMTPGEVNTAEKDGWTGGCFALGAKLGKPRRSDADPIPSTQEELDANPTWPTIQENRLISLLKEGRHFTPESMTELHQIFPAERIAGVLQKLPPESFEKLTAALRDAGEPLPEIPHIPSSVPPPALIPQDAKRI
jgi:hypothetical protein